MHRAAVPAAGARRPTGGRVPRRARRRRAGRRVRRAPGPRPLAAGHLQREGDVRQAVRGDPQQQVQDGDQRHLLTEAHEHRRVGPGGHHGHPAAAELTGERAHRGRRRPGPLARHRPGHVDDRAAAPPPLAHDDVLVVEHRLADHHVEGPLQGRGRPSRRATGRWPAPRLPGSPVGAVVARRVRDGQPAGDPPGALPGDQVDGAAVGEVGGRDQLGRLVRRPRRGASPPTRGGLAQRRRLGELLGPAAQRARAAVPGGRRPAPPRRCPPGAPRCAAGPWR